MSSFYVPSKGFCDWRARLADPEKHWRRHKSALELAVSWESAQSRERLLPPAVEKAIDSNPDTRGARLLIGFPEHQVSFEGGGHSSQNDLWALLRTERDLVSMTVEGKSGEAFDKKVKDWLPQPGERSNKEQRLEALLKDLGLAGADVSEIRYQLLHRSASAMREAVRFGARIAVMLVQSFGGESDRGSWDDFRQFSRLLGTEAVEGTLVSTRAGREKPLLIGWVSCDLAGGEWAARAEAC